MVADVEPTRLRHRVAGALLWTGSAQVARQGLTILIAILLARMLGPAEFGRFAMLAIFVGLAEVLFDGFGSALVQRPNLDDRQTSSVFWFVGCLALVTTGVWILAVPGVVALYGSPQLASLAFLLSGNFILAAARSVPMALHTRAMRFRPIAIAEITATLIAGAAALFLALRGAGAWALAAQLLLRNAIVAAVLWYTARWRPRLTFSPAVLKEVLDFGGHLSLFRIVTYGSSRLDRLVIGSVFGAASLGAFTKAHELMLLPLKQINAVVSRVMFPALSSIQSNPERVRSIYLRGVASIVLLVAPVMLGGSVLAEPLVIALLGESWADTVPLLRVFFLIGLSHCMGMTTGWIFLSQGATRLMLMWGIFAALVRGGALVIGLRWGPMGIAVAHLVLDHGILLYPVFVIPGRLIGMSFLDVVRAVRAPLLCSGVMAVIVAAAGAALPPTIGPWAQLAIQISLGAGVYVATVHAFRLAPYAELRRLAGELYFRHVRRVELAS